MPENQDSAGSSGEIPPLDIAASATPEDALYKAGYLDSPPLLGQTGSIGTYELLEELGHGGMGIVYLARDSATGLRVAVKILRPELAGSKQAVSRFLNEAGLTETLRHKHIVPILDVSLRPEQPYFVMPFYSKGSLADLLHRQGMLPVEMVLRFGVQIATALVCAHQANAMHGDVKPSNVLIDDELNVRLADFGLARDFSSNSGVGKVRKRGHRGTPPYMSPLMAQGKGEGLSSDIYMFGATMYEFLTGRPPYAGETQDEIIGKIRTQPPTPILTLRPDAPRDLVRIIERALERDENKRYSTMRAVQEDLNSLANPQPLDGVPPSNSVVSWRRRAIAALAVVAVGLLAASGAWLAWSGPRAAVKPELEVVRSFQVPGVRVLAGALPGDWDGDGTTDLYLLKNHTFMVVSAEGEVLNEHPLSVPQEEHVWLSFAGDANRDGRDEAFLNWSSNGNMYIDVLGPGQFSMVRFKAKGKTVRDPSDVQHTSVLIPDGLYDFDGDNRRELLVKVRSGFQLEPRGVGCFDMATQKLLWRYLTAPGPDEIAVGDVTADGKLEIALGSYSTTNGVKLANGTDDAHAYLYLLDNGGNLIWMKELGERFTQVAPFIADLDGNGCPSLVAMVSTGPEYRPTENGHVHRLDKLGQITSSFDAGAAIMGLRIAPLVPGRSPQLIVADRLGRIHLLDKDLSLQCREDLPHDPARDMFVQVHAVEDLDGDGQSEIVLTSHEREKRIIDVTGEAPVTFTYNHEILVLNADLSIRARYELCKERKAYPGVNVIVADADHDGRKEMIVLAEAVIILRLGR